MAWYRTGTITINAGETSVSGVGTKFASNARVGDALRGPDGEWYEVVNIASETTLGIYPPYQGPSASSTNTWVIAPMQGYVKESADRLREITRQLRDVNAEVEMAKEARVAAEEAAAAAKVSEDAALGVKDTVLAARDAAAASETNAKTSENNSKTSETNSLSYRDQALASQNAAKTSQDAAKTSQDAAAASQTAAAGSATAASTSASTAQTARTGAETARDQAVAARTAAQSAETNAATARNAAQASQSAAKTSEDNALASRNAAQASQTAAKGSEDKAKAWAVNPEDTAVETGQYSALHWAAKAKASADAAAGVTGPRLTSIAQAVTAVNDILIADTTTTMKALATGAKGRELLGVATAAAGRTSLELGNGATLDVTANTKDGTTDRLMKTGDFGLGQLNSVSISGTELDSETLPTGMYRIDVAAAGWKGLPAGAYSVWNNRLNNTVSSGQIAMDYANGLIWTRGRGTDNFSSGGGGVTNPPLLNSFLDPVIPTGFYRGFGATHPQITEGAPPGSGTTALSIIVTAGLNSSYTGFIVIAHFGSTNRFFVGNRASSGAAPVWDQIVKVGDYGIGSYAERMTVTTADSKTIIANGFYDILPTTQAGWPNTPFPNAWTRLMNISHNNSAGYWTQLAFDFNVNPRMKVRNMSAGTLGDWREVYTQTSAVGTVSMSGGVPDGAIIERGNSGNGNYVKYADGTLICWQNAFAAGGAVAIGTAIVGSTLYQTPSATVYTFPQAFIATPTVTVSVLAVSGFQRLIPVMNTLTTAQVGIVGYGPVTDSRGYYQYIAVGRWA